MPPVAVTLLVLGLVAVIGGIVVFAVSSRLVATMLLALGALAVVTGWLLPEASRADALKTGGLAAGAVVALYALWLNDRRRRVDDDRQRLENERAAHDRERAADDRFLRAVELLGHETDQVRVGALHALAGVARARPEYTQDVLDVLCSYLRRPFDHPEYAEARGVEYEGAPLAEADRWRVVRMTAQRLVSDLLPKTGDGAAPAYNLDLTGATLEYCDLSDRVIGQLRARAMKLYQSNTFVRCDVRGDAWFTNTESWGNLWLSDVEFHGLAWFRRVRTHARLGFGNTVFHGRTSFTDGVFAGSVKPPPGWKQDGTSLVQD